MSNDGAPRSLGGVHETLAQAGRRQLGDAIDADVDCLVTLRLGSDARMSDTETTRRPGGIASTRVATRSKQLRRSPERSASGSAIAARRAVRSWALALMPRLRTDELLV